MSEKTDIYSFNILSKDWRKMAFWKLTINNEEKLFNSFFDAAKALKKQIADYLMTYPDDYRQTAIPYEIYDFFEQHLEEIELHDIESELRSELLLESLYAYDPFLSSDNSSLWIKESFNSSIKDINANENANINIVRLNDEIKADITYSGKTKLHLKTNAFIFDNDTLTYYFSHQREEKCFEIELIKL